MLALVGDAKDGLREGLRGGSFRGLEDLPGATFVGDTENRRGGAFRGLCCRSSALKKEREDTEGLRGGCFNGLVDLSPSVEPVLRLFLAGSSIVSRCFVTGRMQSKTRGIGLRTRRRVAVDVSIH